MPMTLWVAEKKTLAEAVAKVLPGVSEYDWSQKGMTYNRVGDNYFVWLDGHAFLQAMPDYYLPDSVPKNGKGQKVWRDIDLPIIPAKWVLFPNETKLRRLNKLAELLKTCTSVINLGDPDPEGQVLIDEALEVYKYKGWVQRVLVNDYNATKVRQSIAAIRDNNELMFRGWYKMGVARARYDWLFGLNGTRAFTLRGRSLGFDGVLSVGSVQTPLLYIVRERDRVIEEFKSVPYFTLSASIRHANGEFKANWRPGSDQAGLDDDERLTDGGIADALSRRLTGQAAEILTYSKEAKETGAPLPLAMDELQMDAFRKYGYNGETVLAAAQKLYEVYKVTSYPRSTNRYLSEAQHGEARNVLTAVFQVRPDLKRLAGVLSLARKSDAFNDKKMVGNPHHGIVPAIPESAVNEASWTEIERNIYDMVVRSYMAQFAAPYQYMATSIDVDVAGEWFAASGNTPVAQGWKAIYAEAEVDGAEGDAESGEVQTLPSMDEGDQAICEHVDVQKRKTKAPPRFDDALLVEAMKNIYLHITDEKSRKLVKDGDGIGTSATRAPMIAEIKARGLLILVKAGGTKWMTSPALRALMDALPMDVKDPARAGMFKSALDLVSKSEGNATFDAFMRDSEQWVRGIVEMAKTAAMVFPDTGVSCPKCGVGQLKRVKGANGWFWSCNRWNAEPKCATSFNDVWGKPQLMVGAAAPVAGAGPVKKAVAGKDAVKCPKCGEGMVLRTGVKGGFYGCSAYPKCNGTVQVG
jgi:DNA topoisomerase-3